MNLRSNGFGVPPLGGSGRVNAELRTGGSWKGETSKKFGGGWGINTPPPPASRHPLPPRGGGWGGGVTVHGKPRRFEIAHRNHEPLGTTFCCICNKRLYGQCWRFMGRTPRVASD